MKKTSGIPKTVNEYIAQFPVPVQRLLKQMRKTIREAAPAAEETIGYQIPAYKQNGFLVYFAAFTQHIGFYPTSSGIDAFRGELSKYHGGRGSVRFPFDEPLPIALIRRIVKHRVSEDKKAGKASTHSATRSDEPHLIMRHSTMKSDRK